MFNSLLDIVNSGTVDSPSNGSNTPGGIVYKQYPATAFFIGLFIALIIGITIGVFVGIKLQKHLIDTPKEDTKAKQDKNDE